MAARKGVYDDAINVKRHQFDLLLHETLGGGFSPPSLKQLHKLAKKAGEGVDRTRYTARRHISFKVHHATRISVACVKYNSRGIKREVGRLAASPRVVARLAPEGHFRAA